MRNRKVVCGFFTELQLTPLVAQLVHSQKSWYAHFIVHFDASSLAGQKLITYLRFPALNITTISFPVRKTVRCKATCGPPNCNAFWKRLPFITVTMWAGTAQSV